MEERDWEGVRALQESSHANAVAKGFWENTDLSDKEKIGNKLLLIVGEVIEAHEEIRAGIEPGLTYYPTMTAPTWMGPPEKLHKPEGVPSEFADIIIRVCDLAGALGIDLASAIEEKALYNAGRPFKHNKAF